MPVRAPYVPQRTYLFVLTDEMGNPFKDPVVRQKSATTGSAACAALRADIERTGAVCRFRVVGELQGFASARSGIAYLEEHQMGRLPEYRLHHDAEALLVRTDLGDGEHHEPLRDFVASHSETLMQSAYLDLLEGKRITVDGVDAELV